MEDNFEKFDSPISTLKVDFGCSKNCPNDVKTMLQQLKGVKSISIDPNEGKVTVEGNVHPMILIKLLQKMGKKAKLYSFDKEPLQRKSSSHHKHKDARHCRCDGSHSEYESDTDSDHDCIHRARHGQKERHKHKHKHGFGDFHNEHAATPPPVSGYHYPPPPPPPPHMSGYHHPPMPGYHHQYQPFSGYHSHPQMQRFQPMSYARPPPMYPGSMPPYGGYYGRGQPMGPNYGHYGSRLSRHNPMIHYNSYADNFRY